MISPHNNVSPDGVRSSGILDHFWNFIVSSDATVRAAKPSASLALVKATGWGKGFSILTRITVMAFRHPWQASFAIGATLVASAFQLMIPQFLGRAVDKTQVVLKGGDAGQAAQDALLTTAVMLLGASVLRGLFTLVQNYYSEAVGHHMGYRLRLACYEKSSACPSPFTTACIPAISSPSACSIWKGCGCIFPPPSSAWSC